MENRLHAEIDDDLLGLIELVAGHLREPESSNTASVLEAIAARVSMVDEGIEG